MKLRQRKAPVPILPQQTQDISRPQSRGGIGTSSSSSSNSPRRGRHPVSQRGSVYATVCLAMVLLIAFMIVYEDIPAPRAIHKARAFKKDKLARWLQRQQPTDRPMYERMTCGPAKGGDMSEPEVVAYRNDNYCDCWQLDGSDEPGTSACSHLTVGQKTFGCGDEAHTHIFASRVHDGVPDCPNGADEASMIEK